jgi:putative ABC transport system substrate-binding protein
MDRRTFVASVAGGFFAVPLAGRAQRPAMPVIGYLSLASPAQWALYVAGFRKGLSEVGYAEGKNVAIEFRWAEGHYDRLPALAADLVNHHVAVLVTAGGTGAALAAKVRIPAKLTDESDDVDRVVSCGAWRSDFSAVGHHRCQFSVLESRCTTAGQPESSASAWTEVADHWVVPV